MPDESYAFRLVPQGQTKEPNCIEVYKGCNFDVLTNTIVARFPVKPAKKSDPIKFVNGKFDGLDLCPRNPANPTDSPFYLLAWQHAAIMTDEETNGTVYFYDINSTCEKSKFMIQCPRGQEIKTLVSSEGHAVLIWS
jgi:hypothetical protein